MSHILFRGYPYPAIPLSGSVKTSGQFGDLKAAAGSVSIGLFDAMTYGIATGTGNGKDFFIGYSSEHKVDDLTYHMAGMKNPRKTQVFSGKDVVSFEFSDPQRPVNETWVLGYNGAPSSVGLSFKKGSAYGIMIDLEGNPIFRVFGKSLRHEIWITTDPDTSTDCETGCDDGVDCEKYTKRFVDAINNHVELSKLGVKARARLSTFVAPSDTINRYQITLNDGCGDLGLATVQAVVGLGAQVKVIAKNGCATTYEVCQASAPGTVTPPREYALATCDACASGYTLVPAQDTWIIRRPLAGTEDLDSDADRDTYADTVGTAYSVATDADKIFLGQDGAVAVVQIRVTVGTAITALLSDTVEKAATTVAMCISDTVPSAVSWTDVGDAYRIQRDLTITLPRLDCSLAANRLTELTAYVTQFADYVTSSIEVSPAAAEDGACADDYTISQWSQGCMELGCESVDGAMFLDFPGYDGQVWKVATTADAADTGKKCGIEITAGYVDTKFGNCSFDYNDYYEMEPIRLAITNLTQYPFPQPFQLGLMPTAFKQKSAQIGRQSGEWIIREFIKSGSYEPFGDFQTSPRVREALDNRRLEQVDRNAYYRVYYLSYHAKREGTDQKKELFETPIFVKETDVAKYQALEAAFMGVLAKFGVVLKNRGV